MSRFALCPFLILASGAFFCCCAQEDWVSQQEHLQLKHRVEELEQRIAAFEAGPHRQVPEPTAITDGLEIAAGGTMIVQHASSGSGVDASYSADLSVARQFEGIDGMVFLHLEAGDGSGIEDDLILFSNVNRDADDDNDLGLTELWYEQEFAGTHAVLTFGKLDPTAYFDTNAAANDETTQFLGRIFRNSPAVEFPDNTAGIRAALRPAAGIELGYGVFDGDADWEKIGDASFHIVEAAVSPSIRELAGHYRLYGWFSDMYHTKWLDEAESKEPAYGFGLSFDQQVTELVTLFCRYGWQDPRVYNPDISAAGGLPYSLEHAWSFGVQASGGLWGRDDDVFGCAVGQAVASGEYKKAVPERRAWPEGHLEAYYRFFVNEHLSVSPDLQYIWDPFGGDLPEDESGVLVAGVRAQVDF